MDTRSSFEAYYIDLETGEKVKKGIEVDKSLGLSYRNTYLAAVCNAYDYAEGTHLHLMRVDFLSF